MMASYFYLAGLHPEFCGIWSHIGGGGGGGMQKVWQR